ncbi:tRNA pseudouridine(38-40) synthase TruA [Spiroplasma endosymbiont of Crioceris asparagi]|uniref:tRNA pseudouridine(38-40) synthase TruA n=1 Tax=Spiroplasma endosymbiont of Crioceris asparagi TaxID=3066286 RepID=UPI0030CEE4F6
MKSFLLLTIEYDGYDFCGWAKQNKQKTIQGELEAAIFVVLKTKDFKTLGASKTDSEVHAEDQKVYLELPFKPQLISLKNSVNKALPISIKIKDIKEISPDFKVRHCKEKIYNYIFYKKEPGIFQNRYGVYINNFNFQKFWEALKIFEGEHNFLNFAKISRSNLGKIKTIRTINQISFKETENEFICEFFAKGFIRYQIRMIVGAAIAYAQELITIEQIKAVLLLEEPKLKYIAPGKGLILKKIFY